jgi:acyl transferase domain-containing protein
VDAIVKPTQPEAPVYEVDAPNVKGNLVAVEYSIRQVALDAEPDAWSVSSERAIRPNLGRLAARGQLRQRSGRDRPRAVQDRGQLLIRTLALAGAGRARHLRGGGTGTRTAGCTVPSAT